MPPDPFNIPRVGPRDVGMDPRQLRTAAVRPNPAEGASFKDVLTETVSEVQRLHDHADNTIKKLVAGEIKDVTEALVAVEKADVAFQTMMVVRNKIVAAYEEIMRMQV